MQANVKKWIVQLASGANVATILVMLGVGYSDRVNPEGHPLLATLGLTFPVFLAINAAFMVFWVFFRLRRVLIPVIGFVVCYGPVRAYIPFNMNPTVPDSCFKVLSYNTLMWGGGEATEAQRWEMLNYVKAKDADILCLQEANLGGKFQNTIDSLLNSIYPYHDIKEKTTIYDRLAIYSKYPILHSQRVMYPQSADFSQACWVATPDDTVLVINNHFATTGLTEAQRQNFKNMLKGDLRTKQMPGLGKSLIHKLGEYAQVRAPQVDAVARFVRKHKGHSVILCGDFNDSPISYARHRMAKELTDCYVASGNGPGISYHRNAFYVRIDNIMCSDDWQPLKCVVESKVKTSDHYPIFCQLQKVRK